MLGAHRPEKGRARSGHAASPRESQHGQSLVELALVLPLILMLTLVALDFGRVYLGYINIQNMARIAANYAANNPLAWGTSPDAGIQERYRNQVLEDASATNCQLPVVGGQRVVPDPSFADADADGIAAGLGDTVTVQLHCSFQVITPMIANILGGSVAVSAESNFPVKAGMTSVVVAGGGGGGGGGGVTAPPSAAFVANSSVFSPTDITIIGPSVAVDFRDASGGGIATTYDWDFGDGATSIDQDVVHGYTCALVSCSYIVTMTAGNPYGSTSAFMQVTVVGDAEVNFTSDRQVIDRGQTVTFTDTSTAGGTSWAWDFGDGATGSGATAAHTYSTTSGSPFTVTLTVTYPGPVTPPAAVKTAYITVTPGYCTVPSLTNVMFDKATVDVWRHAPYNFTGTVLRADGAPKSPSNFKITAQSIASGNGATALCNSDVYVSSP